MATLHLLDTNTISFLADRNPSVIEHIRLLDVANILATCFIVVGEWEYGIQHAPGAVQKSELRISGNAIFSKLSAIYESTPEVALKYGQIQAHLRTNGQLIPTNDIWIAATALIYV